jgi:DNA processing protein
METPDKAFLAEFTGLNVAKTTWLEKFYGSLEIALADKFTSFYSQSTQNIDSSFNRFSRWFASLTHLDWSSYQSKKDSFLQNLDKHKISILDSEGFPEEIKNLTDCPCVLYFKGDPSVLSCKHKLTVVGSRNLQKYTEQIMQMVLQEYRQNLVIISGLAVGVDALAHKLALKGSLKCIAVIGSGLDQGSFYPAENYDLLSQIVDSQGLVLSEYQAGTRSTIYTFPMRNRFLAALGQVCWVSQAKIKSGSLITAKLALEFGQTLATTPANILDKNFQGNTELLKQGAHVITSQADLDSLLGLTNLQTSQNTSTKMWQKYEESSQKSASEPPNLNPLASQILSSLDFSGVVVQDLVLKTGLNAQQLNTQLSLLEMSNLVENLGQNTWVRL